MHLKWIGFTEIILPTLILLLNLKMKFVIPVPYGINFLNVIF